MDRRDVVLDGARTPVGGFREDDLKDVPAHELGAAAVRAALERAQVPPSDVEQLVMVLRAGGR